MHTQYIDSMGLPKGLQIGLYDSVEELDKAAGKSGTALEFANQHLGEKDGLVAGRKAFTKKLNEITGFAFITSEVERTNPTTKQKEKAQQRDESDNKYVARFRTAVEKGEYVNDLFPKDEVGLDNALQKIADDLGVFNTDPKAAVREGKAKTPPKGCLAAADNIIAKSSQPKWAATFRKEGIEFAPFDAVVPADATPEASAAILATNRANLAWAIHARESKALAKYQ